LQIKAAFLLLVMKIWNNSKNEPRFSFKELSLTSKQTFTP